MNPDTPPTPDEELEDLLAGLLERLPEEGPPVVEEVCSANPTQAARLRSRLEQLARLGLLEGLDGTTDDGLPERIGTHEVLGLLGRGGMSMVLRVRDERVGREVALKALTGWGVGGRSRERFEREIRAVSQLSHPCIVPVHDFGEEDGRPWFTMELVPGASLSEVLAQLRAQGGSLEQLDATRVLELVRELGRGRSGEEVASSGKRSGSYIELVCAILADIADALELAHSQGIIHRDVKPSNIMLRADGRAQLCDFGLAHLEHEATLTLSGEFTGTPHYVAPEQLESGRTVIDARTDVYGLGVCLYELLTQRRPFEGEGDEAAAALLHRIQTREAPTPRSVEPAIPRDLETICLQAMDRDRGRRYASAGELASDLRRFLEFRPVRARPVGALRRGLRRARANPASTVAWGLALLLVLAIPIGLLWSSALVRDQRDSALAALSEADRQARQSERVTAYLLELLRSGSGSEVPEEVRQLFERRLEELASGVQPDVLVRAALLETSGRVADGLELPERALPYYDLSYALLRGELGEKHPQVAGVLLRLARTHLETGEPRTAADIAQRALSGLDALQLEPVHGEPVHGGSEQQEASLRVELGLLLATAQLELGALESAGETLDEVRNRLRPEPGSGSSGAHSEERRGLLSLLLEAESRLALEGGRPLEALTLAEEAALEYSRLRTPAPARLFELTGACQLLAQREGSGELSGEVSRLHQRLALAATRVNEAMGQPLPPDPLVLADPSAVPFAQAFQRGVTDLQARRAEEAVAAFEACVELRPDHAVSRYNLACALALGGLESRALETLEGAVERGFGSRPLHIEVARKDSDLASLRETPRGQELLRRMERSRSRAGARPPLLLEEGAAGRAAGEARPLWVVLHAEGSRPADVLDGPWGQLAREHGALLLAPAADAAVSEDPDGGLRWLDRVEDFERVGPQHEARILAAVESVVNGGDGGDVDREHVLLAGEGQASLLAWDLGLRLPGLFRRVILVDGPPYVPTSRERARTAARLGQEITVLSGPGLQDGGGPELEELLGWVRALGLRADGEVLGGDRPGALERALGLKGSRPR